MTPRVWLERPITSVEDAEALPIGAVALLMKDGSVRDHATRTSNPLGPWNRDMHGYRHSAVLGWTALVPVEAEEETLYAYAVQDDWVGDEKVTRLVTPWERM